ncbi:MAG: LytTR family DNA-binding domain-containing protein [Flavipsychrobacter sp.]|nr:LytTR family DNA-binding domain-containing protein [Flavipsychrobacter sp.]
MDNITCIIVDDESDALELLKLCINDLYPQLKIVGMYNNWKDAFHALNQAAPDILFTDISMPEKTGMDMLKLLPGIKSEIIFTTAHSEYALPAFQFSPSGYLLKPVIDADLVFVVNKALERIRYKKMATAADQHTFVNKIGIHNNKGIDYIPVSSIIYLESFNKCTKVITDSNEYISSYYLGTFKPMLGDAFYQVHRSFIVNLNSIVRYASSGVIVMSNKKEIPLARSSREQFLKLFNVINNTSHLKDQE